MIFYDLFFNNIVVKLLQDNNFVKVKFFDVDLNVIEFMWGINLEVMVVIINDMFVVMVVGIDVVVVWVKQNVIVYFGSGGVNIKYVFFLLFCIQLSFFYVDMIFLKKLFRFGVGSIELIELKLCLGR